MNLNYSSKAFSQLTYNELSKKSAIHQAVHALVLYLGNRQRQLSPLYFQIYLKELRSCFELSRLLAFMSIK